MIYLSPYLFENLNFSENAKVYLTRNAGLWSNTKFGCNRASKGRKSDTFMVPVTLNWRKVNFPKKQENLTLGPRLVISREINVTRQFCLKKQSRIFLLLTVTMVIIKTKLLFLGENFTNRAFIIVLTTYHLRWSVQENYY